MNKSEQLTHQVFDSPEFGRMRILQEGENTFSAPSMQPLRWDTRTLEPLCSVTVRESRNATPSLLAAFKACPTLLRAICTG